MAACTSWAAASMLRDRSNCRVMVETPSWLLEVIESSPAMVVNCRSSGVATALSVGDHHLTRRETLLDHRHPLVLDGHDHRPRLDGAVLLHHEHVLALLPSLDRLARRDGGIADLSQRHRRHGEGARPERLVLVL